MTLSCYSVTDNEIDQKTGNNELMSGIMHVEAEAPNIFILYYYVNTPSRGSSQLLQGEG